MPDSRALGVPSRTADELREIARDLAVDLVGRGMSLNEIERTAALMVDQARLAGATRPAHGQGRNGRV